MKIIYALEAKNQLLAIKEYIAIDNKNRAIQHLRQIKTKIELLGKYPYLGKVNATIDNERVREFVVMGYKVIYKINEKSITVLVIYKYIDFDETSL
ncbi:MAG: Unknown protein [uncultured Sulfurovum sp.]|uniref:Type II toxin-antitoxin system RelE/ParE family toxin n=1 Tax=uncultured Sulfurovum sp. TaxID=269237 RepID=A0A6S6TPU9_9BACT|nr:MAG: Unknown protein [uncultured Sulfurovum sp.]